LRFEVTRILRHTSADDAALDELHHSRVSQGLFVTERAGFGARMAAAAPSIALTKCPIGARRQPLRPV
jgi:hypothetical protein